MAASTLASGCGENDPSGDLLLRADRVFDGEQVIKDGAVLIADERIMSVAAADEIDGDATRTLDLGDATILPGLIDLHVHVEHLSTELILASGVTTVRDLGASFESLAGSRTRAGMLRILPAGPIITVPSGYPIPVHGNTVALPISGAAEAREAVNRLADRGATVIKISIDRGGGRWPTLQNREIREIVAAAHGRKIKVAAHVMGVEDARLALEGGVDELAHMPCDKGDPDLMRELAEAGVAIVGTLHVEENFSCPASLANARLFVDADGSLLYGTDLNNPGIPLGLDTDELRLLQTVGLSSLDALRAATAQAARLLDDDSLGRLAPGATADVLVVEGDAIRDTESLGDVLVVISGGTIVVEDGVLANR